MKTVVSSSTLTVRIKLSCAGDSFLSRCYDMLECTPMKTNGHHKPPQYKHNPKVITQGRGPVIIVFNVCTVTHKQLMPLTAKETNPLQSYAAPQVCTNVPFCIFSSFTGCEGVPWLRQISSSVCLLCQDVCTYVITAFLCLLGTRTSMNVRGIWLPV
ncbi:unnamed protein product [Caretta caretta]